MAIESQPRRPPSPVWLLALVPLAAGAWWGYGMAYAVSRGGEIAGLAYVFGFMALAVPVVVLLLVGAAARSRRRISRGAFLTAGLLVAGTIAGIALTPALGLEYVPPVTLHAEGSLTVAIAGVDQLSANPKAPADCSSVPDGRGVAFLAVNRLGTLRGARLLASLLIVPAESRYQFELEIGGEAVDPGGLAPIWDGVLTNVQVSADGTSGSGEFLLVGSDPLAKGVEGTPAPSLGPWPGSIAGSLTWLCGAWSTPPG